jgi:hypothetical protein
LGKLIFFPCYVHIQLKEKYRTEQQGGLFGGLLKAEQFVAANLPSSYDQSVSFFFSPSEVAYSTYVVASVAVPCCLLIYALLLNTIQKLLIQHMLLLQLQYPVAYLSMLCCLIQYM